MFLAGDRLKPAPFRYERPLETSEALALLSEHGADAKILAGGQSLLPLLNMRLVRPSVVIDINRIASLDAMRTENGHLAIGAIARDRDVERWSQVRLHCPIVAEALRHVGHVEIRNRGTVCGSLAHADPAAELPLVAVALEAVLVVESVHGRRTVPAVEFFRSFFTTALRGDELLTEVRLPMFRPGTGWGFVEFARRRGDFAVAAAATLLKCSPDGLCTNARIAVGGVGPTPLRARHVEQSLIGERLTPKRIAC